MTNVEVLEHLKGYPFKTSQQDIDPKASYTTFLKNPKGRTASEMFIDNPVITDVTQAEQTDLKYLFQQNPELSGLALMVTDESRQDELATVSVEDFLEPADHYDIFDIQNFIDNSKKQFNKLPIALRKKYNNNPLELVKHFETDYPAALASMQEYFQPLMPNRESSGTAPRQGAVITPEPSTKVDSNVQSKVTDTPVKEN